MVWLTPLSINYLFISIAKSLPDIHEAIEDIPETFREKGAEALTEFNGTTLAMKKNITSLASNPKTEVQKYTLNSFGN
ncbi:MAG: hypothetical protein ABUK01_08605 [Leptospirales bacterium]